MMRRHFDERVCPKNLCLYYGDGKDQFIETLRQVNLDKTDLCVAFERLSPVLYDAGWHGAAIYVLRQPLPNHFMAPWGGGSYSLVDFDIASFFVLYSGYTGGRFEDLEQNVLKDILKEYYGPDVIMEQG